MELNSTFYAIFAGISKWFGVLQIRLLDTLVNDFHIDALFCSNGPGDPAHQGKASLARNTLAEAVRAHMPVMGICLGHQLMGLCFGLQTYKMRYGHRGANQPVVDLKTGLVSITSQNHGFAVADPEAGMLAAHPSGACSDVGENLHGAEVAVRFVNANDRNCRRLGYRWPPIIYRTIPSRSMSRAT